MRNADILLLSADYGEPRGGMGRSLQWIVSVLKKQSAVHVASPQKGADTVCARKLYAVSGQWGFSLFLFFKLNALLTTVASNRVLVPVGPGGVCVLRKTAAPLTSIVYHTYRQQAALVPGQRWKRVFIPFEKRTLKQSASVICFCADTKRVLVDAYHIQPEKILLLPHALDDSWFMTGTEKNPQHCIFVGRLDRRKGIDVLLKAWPKVIQKVPQATLVVVGNGPYAKKLKKLCKKHPSSLTWKQQCSLSVLQQHVRSSCLALCPSYLEGYGLAALEAMASGTPVIACKRDGLQSVIEHSHNGILVPAGDAAAYASAIIDCLEDAPKTELLGKQAHNHAYTLCNSVHAEKEVLQALKNLR